MTTTKNTQILNALPKKLIALLTTLSEKYHALCFSDKTIADITLALKSKDNDIICSLDILAKITTLLAIVRVKGELCYTKYPYQGSGELYNLLDEIRHEYRMFDLDLVDQGIVSGAKESTNNIAVVT
jgi:hypothetical protein